MDKRNLQIIEEDWHFSFFHKLSANFKKIKSFSHGEFNDQELNEEQIEKKIIENKDIFGRDLTLKKVELTIHIPNIFSTIEIDI